MYHQAQGEVPIGPSHLCPNAHVVRAVGLAAAAQLEGAAYRHYGQPMPTSDELATLALQRILAARNCADPSGHLCEPGAASGL